MALANKAWTNRPTPWLVAGLFVHAFFLFALFNDFLRPFFNDASHTRRGFDFGVFYLAGQALAEGRDIYSVQGAFGFRYLPPFAQTIGRFFALFQPITSYILHLCFTELFLAINLWLTWRWVDEYRRGIAIFMWLAYSPYFLELYMGQVSFWAASLLFWLIVGLERGQGRWTGLFWAGAILVKPNALILVPGLLRLRAFRILALGLLISLLSSIPYFMLHPDSVTAFIQSNTQGGHIKGALTHAGNLGLQGGLVSLIAKLCNRPLAELSTLNDLPAAGWISIYISQLILLLIGLFATLRYRPHQPVQIIALWICTFFLVYKDIWEHHYVFLLPIFIALYAQSFSPKLLWLFAVIALPTPFIFIDIESGRYGAIDPEREWAIGTSLLYRSSKLLPLAYLWFTLCRTNIAKPSLSRS
jgi:hypothetical protein